MAKRTPKRAKKRNAGGSIFKDERITKILGVICFFIGIFLIISFISYFFSWKYDQDKVLTLSTSLLFNGDVSVQNWMGRFGAYVSNLFFYWGFGISSFFFIFLIFRLGLDLIRKAPLKSFFDLALHAFLLACFISVVMEFIMIKSEFSWGGLMGCLLYTSDAADE